MAMIPWHEPTARTYSMNRRHEPVARTHGTTSWHAPPTQTHRTIPSCFISSKPSMASSVCTPAPFEPPPKDQLQAHAGRSKACQVQALARSLSASATVLINHAAPHGVGGSQKTESPLIKCRATCARATVVPMQRSGQSVFGSWGASATTASVSAPFKSQRAAQTVHQICRVVASRP